jgi:hypothetical protein
VYKERGLGFPVLAYGNYIRYHPRASMVSPLGEDEQIRLWKESKFSGHPVQKLRGTVPRNLSEYPRAK